MAKNWTPDAIMASPEKRELVAAIDAARIDAWLAAIPAEPTDAELRALLACLEHGAWRDDERISPIRWVKLSEYQRSVLKVKVAPAIVARGGSIDAGREVWRAEGEKVWKTLPWGESR